MVNINIFQYSNCIADVSSGLNIYKNKTIAMDHPYRSSALVCYRDLIIAILSFVTLLISLCMFRVIIIKFKVMWEAMRKYETFLLVIITIFNVTMIITFGVGANHSNTNYFEFLIHHLLSRLVLLFAIYYFFIKSVKGQKNKKKWKKLMRLALFVFFFLEIFFLV